MKKPKVHTADFFDSRSPIEIIMNQEIMKAEFKKAREYNKTNINKTGNNEKNKEFTERRRVLFMHYLFKLTGIKNIDTTEKARAIQFLFGGGNSKGRIQDTNIYKLLSNPLDSENIINDLEFLIPFFDKLKLTEIVKMIKNEIDTSESLVNKGKQK